MKFSTFALNQVPCGRCGQRATHVVVFSLTEVDEQPIELVEASLHNVYSPNGDFAAAIVGSCTGCVAFLVAEAELDVLDADPSSDPITH